MVKVSGVPYDVDPSDIKVSVSEIQKQAMNQGLDIAIEYLNELHKMHEKPALVSISLPQRNWRTRSYEIYI
jgi:hypothetical protein